MLYAVDTEFMEDGHTIELISIALVAEDGREFYRQVVNADHSRANAFVAHHVLPQLTDCGSGMGKGQHWSLFSSTKWSGCVAGCPSQWREYIGQEMQIFCGRDPQFIAYYAAYDWVALCQLFWTMMDLPKGWPMYCRDLRQWLDDNGGRGITQPDAMTHHALSDARWIMQTWQQRYSLLAENYQREGRG